MAESRGLRRPQASKVGLGVRPAPRVSGGHRLLGEITEGEAREEVCSRANDLVFISTALICGENRQVRQSIVRFKDPEGVLGLEISRAQESLA